MASDMRVMKTPESLELNITGRCNLRCSYCSHFSSAGDTHMDLATEEWLMLQLDKIYRQILDSNKIILILLIQAR